MIKCFRTKTLLFCRYIPVYQYAPFVATSSAYGEPRLVYGGISTIAGYDDGYFFPNMGGSITCALDLPLLRRFSNFSL
jgi:hypothetical protein